MNQNYPEFEVLDLGLVLYKNIIPNPQEIIKTLNDVDQRFRNNEHQGKHTSVSEWSPWTYGEQSFCEKKYLPPSSKISDDDPYVNELRSMSDTLYSSLSKALDHYADVLYPYAGRVIKGREVSIDILKYKTGGYLPAHQDQGVSTRVLSGVSYLNDDYEGGEIEFFHSGIKIKPPAGSVIFFPSNFIYVHEVHKITSGERYSLPHWFHNRKDIVESDGTE